MPITWGTPSNPASDTNDATQTWAHTVAPGDNRRLLVLVANRRIVANSVTYDGVPLTRLIAAGNINGIPGNATPASSIWMLSDPPVGTANVSVTHTTDSLPRPRPCAIVAYGVDSVRGTTKNPVTMNDFLSGVTGISTTITTVSGDAVIDCVATANNSVSAETPGAEQTKRYRYRSDTAFAPDGFGSTKPADDTSEAMAWTWTNSSNSCQCVVALVPAASGAALVVQGLSVAVSLDATSLTQAHALAVDDAAIGVSMDALTLSAAGQLSVQDADIAVSVDNVGLVQAHVLAVADMATAVAMDTPALTQAQVLAVDDAGVAVAMDTIGLIQVNTLAVDGMATAVAMDTPALTQAQVLAVDDAAVAVAMDGITLSTGVNLLIDDMSVSVAAENITLTQAGVLVVQGVAIPVSVDAVNLTQAGTLTVDDLFASVGMEAPTLTTGSIVLAVQDAQIAVTMDSPAFTQSHILSIQDVQIVVTMDGAALVVAGATFPYPQLMMNRTTRITMRH